jgi:hypothetical protein
MQKPSMDKKTHLCHRCSTKCIRLDAYDAYACRKCDVWISTPCSDKNCSFCVELAKLDKPSDAPRGAWNDEWNT